MGSWDEAVLISMKFQGRGVEKGKVEKSKEEKNLRGSKFNLVAFLP